MIGFIVQFRTLHRGAPYGIANRAFVLVLFVWTLVTAFCLRVVLLEDRKLTALRPEPLPQP